MNIKTRSVVALVTLAACAPLAFAQDGGQTQQTPPPTQQNQGQGQVMPWRPAGQMGRGGMSPRENMWARNGMRGGMGFGGRGAMGRGFGHGPMPLERIVNNPDMREKLGISAEQAAKIRQQDLDFQKAGVMNRARLQVAHMELNQLMSADKPDRVAIDKKLSEISAAQLVSEQTRVHHRLDMKTALTPDQQAKLKELIQQRRRGMGGPGGPEGGPGRGGRGGRGQNPQGNGTGTPDPVDGTNP